MEIQIKQKCTCTLLKSGGVLQKYVSLKMQPIEFFAKSYYYCLSKINSQPDVNGGNWSNSGVEEGGWGSA